ncbi:FitA-like ribbon-helix-helix domain-containing protein [Pseudomonas citronellolis]|uniref:FitA-like ribbon-helix-helix domain-containing protein n=1 Tax=Pseudomonas citronellolis TaxID=53408 RepID=UPI0008536A5A|nr:plasmid stabilization protein [Pseudomonas humi]
MASITIRNLDDDLVARLRVRAARNGRSMEEELGEILARALSKSEKRGGLGCRIHARFASVGGADIEPPVRRSKARAVVFGE